MKLRKLGSTGISVSEVGIGTWEMAGDVWGPKQDDQCLEAIQRGVSLGATFIDTAAGYGRGHVEELVGAFLQKTSQPRDKLIISTKVKPECGQFAPPPERHIRDFYSPQWIRSQCEESLGRLRTDYVDILFMHTWSPAWGQEDAWHDEMQKLKRSGKIRAIGISIPDEGVTDANVEIATRKVDVIQCVYNAFQQEPEYSLFPLAAKYGVGIVARSPFSSGALVQPWARGMEFPEGDWRGLWPKDVKPGWLDDQVAMSERAKPILRRGGSSNATAALRYILSNADVTTVIPGSADPNHVEENVRATDRPPLTEDVLRDLKDLWLRRDIHGTYNGSI